MMAPSTFMDEIAMSLHTSGILIHADHPDDPVGLPGELGFAGAEEADAGSVSFDEAPSVSILDEFDDSLGASLATVDGGTSLRGPMLNADDGALARHSGAGDVVTVMLEGASGTSGFELYRGGRLWRRRREQAGQVLHDQGEHPAEEREGRRAGKDREGLVLDLPGRLALPIGRLDEPESTRYRLP